MINKKLIFSLLLLLPIHLTYSQSLKIVAGGGVSKVHSSKPIKIFDTSVEVYSIALGLDLLENKKYYLSNEIGFLQMGGKEAALDTSFPEHLKIQKKWNYLFLSSTFRYKLPSTNDSYYFFAGLGPKVSFSINSNAFKNTLYEEGYNLKSILFGANTEVGFIRQWKKFKTGIIGSYLLNITPLGNSIANNLKSYPIYLNITFGYDL